MKTWLLVGACMLLACGNTSPEGGSGELLPDGGVSTSVGPACPQGCDDGNPCTQDTCEAKGCAHYEQTGTACGDACYPNAVCQKGVCNRGISACDTGNTCMQSSCSANGTLVTCSTPQPAPADRSGYYPACADGVGVCDRNGTCKTCGQIGQPCCAGLTCAIGMCGAAGLSTNVCVACGGKGQHCCPSPQTPCVSSGSTCTAAFCS